MMMLFALKDCCSAQNENKPFIKNVLMGLMRRGQMKQMFKKIYSDLSRSLSLSLPLISIFYEPIWDTKRDRQ